MDKILFEHLDKSLSNLRTLSINITFLFRDAIYSDKFLNKRKIITFLKTLKNQLAIALNDFNYVMNQIDNRIPIYYHIDYYGLVLQVTYNTIDELINLIETRFSPNDTHLRELIVNTLPLIQDNIDLAYEWITNSKMYYTEEPSVTTLTPST